MKDKVLLSKREKILNILKKGGIGVLETDTILGFVASALNKKAVERVYEIRGRNRKKPCIILCSDLRDFEKVGIKINNKDKKILKNIFPNQISVILSCPSKKFKYLHKGTETLAVRIPKNKKIYFFLKNAGPLIAPSVNFEGKPPALNFKDAKKYFGNNVDFYFGKSNYLNKPSTIICLKDGKISLIREGAFPFSKIKKIVANV